MSKIINLKEGHLLIAVKRGYRNWTSRFKEEFDLTTRLSQISFETLSYLAQGKDRGTFYIYDLIMGLKDLGENCQYIVYPKVPRDRLP